MIAKCSNCSKMTVIQFKEKHYSDTIRETYFVCNHCKKRYTTFVTDKEVRSKQKRIKQLTGADTTNERVKLQEEVNQRMDKLKRELTKNGI